MHSIVTFLTYIKKPKRTKYALKYSYISLSAIALAGRL